MYLISKLMDNIKCSTPISLCSLIQSPLVSSPPRRASSGLSYATASLLVSVMYALVPLYCGNSVLQFVESILVSGGNNELKSSVSLGCVLQYFSVLCEVPNSVSVSYSKVL